VIDVEAALGEQAFKVAVAQRIAQMPVHRLNDQPRLKVTPLDPKGREANSPLAR
jgi:hypothetical protein